MTLAEGWVHKGSLPALGGPLALRCDGSRDAAWVLLPSLASPAIRQEGSSSVGR